MFLGDLQRAVPGGFPDGMPVVVISGQYEGDVGEVVNRAPDLRPGSVWVNLAAAGIHLVPGYRLAPVDGTESDDGVIPADDHAIPGYDAAVQDRPRL